MNWRKQWHCRCGRGFRRRRTFLRHVHRSYPMIMHGSPYRRNPNYWETYMVVAEYGIHGVYFEYSRAVQVAAAVNGAIISLPIHRDFRTPGRDIAELEKK